MPVCSRNGCKKTYEEEGNGEGACNYHSGAPVFHEGLKSWSCCPKQTVLDFDEFMKIEGCATGPHIPEVEKPKAPPPKPSAPLNTPLSSEGVTETFAGGPSAGISRAAPPPAPAPSTPAPVVEDEDDAAVSVAPGTRCKRKGCKTEFVSDEVNRHGDGEGTVCSYHPGAPIFHEGSKGYFCCKRRVLEFDEFLKIEGCKKGRHVFAPKRQDSAAETKTECRIDHYQTVQDVCVTVYAKQVDKSRSSITIDHEKIDLDLFLPGSKRFTRTLMLYGRVIPENSDAKIMGTKVEINLRKEDGRSWNLLEKSNSDLGSYSLTFGVSGRTGTIGAKQAVLSPENSVMA